MAVLGRGAVSYERGIAVGHSISSSALLWLTDFFQVDMLSLRYRDTSLIRKRTPLGPYRRARPRVLGGS